MRLVRVVSAVVTGALVLGAAACGGSSGKSKTSSGAPTVSKAVPQGNVTWCIGKDTSGAYTLVLDAFNKKYPQAKVKLLELPESADDQRVQLVQRLRAKSSECDVLGMDVIWTAEFASQKWLYDMSGWLSKRASRFIPSTVETTKFQGKYWAAPFDANAALMFYRTDQVPSPPKTWQQAYQEAKSHNGIVYQGAQYEGLTVDFLELLYSAGGKVLSDDGTKSAIDSSQARDALTFMVNGIRDHAVPQAVLTYKEEESRRAFESGQPSLMRNWPYAYALAKKSSIADKFAVAPLPGFGSHPAAGVLGGANLAISAFSKNPEGSLAFIDFATQPDQQTLLGAKASLPPVLAEVYSRPEVKQAMPFAQEALTAVEQAKTRPVSPVYTLISEAIYNNVYSALQGNVSPATAVKRMNAGIEKALKTF